MNRASVFEWHKRFKEGRESVRDDERCGRSKEVNTGQELGLGLLCWGFKGVQEQIPSEEASTLQIRSVAISTRTMHQSTNPSLSQTIWPRWASRHFLTLPIVQTLLPVTFGYSLSSEAVVMRQLRRWTRLWRRSLTRSFQKLLERYNKCIAAGGDYFEGDKSFMRLQSIKVAIRKESLETYCMHLVYCILPFEPLIKDFTLKWTSSPGRTFYLR